MVEGVMAEQRSTNSTRRRTARRRRRFYGLAAAGIAGFALLAGLTVYLRIAADRPGSPALAVPGSPDRDEQLRRAAVGTWRDFYHGTRTLTLREDGTATMVVELSGWKARLFTKRLELDIAWSIEDGKMHRRTLGGRPADKVEFVNRRAGVQVAEPVVELTGDRMVLLDQDGSQRYNWRRLEVK
jgi:hypothetical protein